MILVHAGNRVDAPDRAGAPRFPPSQVEFIRFRLARLLDVLRPEVVSAAAAGADLVLLEEALRLGLQVHVVLPCARDRFLNASVADLGDEWVHRYERVLAALARSEGSEGGRLIEHDEAIDGAGLRRGNAHLLDQAQALAGGGNPPEGVLALAVRPGHGEAPPSVTDDFVHQARLRGLTVIDVDPRLTRSEMARAFVAMPFGTKGHGRQAVNCDATFGKLIVPALEDADLLWERADRQLDRGLIHVGMIEQLGNADVVVVDTATENPNVYYELGLRHAFADRVTVLIGPEGTSPPFDTRPIRHFPYRLDKGAIAEASALDAIEQLSAVLSHARAQSGDRDSPVHEFFELERKPLVSRGSHGREPEDLVDVHRRLSEAAVRGDASALSALAREAGAHLPPGDELRQVLLRIGIELQEHGQPEQAVAVLDSAPHSPEQPGYALWAQRLAMALRQVGDNDAKADPESWQRAQSLLAAALDTKGDDPETCGIAAGLAKQRGVRAFDAGARPLARAHLQLAADLYERGIDADPTNFYAGLNAVTTLRLLGQRLGDSPEKLARARQLLPVISYFVQRTIDADPSDFWAAATRAELLLTGHLLGDPVELDRVLDAYAQAAVMPARPAFKRSVRNQLALYARAGDPSELVQQLQSLFPTTTT